MANIKRSVLFLGIFVAGLLLYISCNETIETPPINPEITYDLEEVEGTQNADMTLSQGEAVGRDSWFEVGLSSIESNSWSLLLGPTAYGVIPASRFQGQPIRCIED